MTRPAPSLSDLGWSNHFLSQLSLDELDTLTPARLSEVGRDQVVAMTERGTQRLPFTGDQHAGDFAVGDWVLSDGTGIARLLERTSALHRRASGHEVRTQLIAANIDTLFITTSCNDDFSVPRLERALALAYEAGVEPVIVLTKADLTDPAPYVAKARTTADGVEVIALNAKSSEAVASLSKWCGPGRTVALIGMSGTGKSTLANALCGTQKATGGIREDDARGRHTTTARSMHPTLAGGWLIDTPGMREMGVMDSAAGIDTVFAEVTALAATCKFRDCAHESEPGCAIRAAIDAGTLDPARLNRWRKLKAEDRLATETVADTRKRQKGFAKHVRSVVSGSHKRKGRP